MSRGVDVGLEYFSVEVDIDEDRKIRLLEAKFQLEGFALYLKLLARIYKENYFIVWDDEEHTLFADKQNVTPDRLTEFLDECFKRGLLNFELKKRYGILTSSGIQKRYILSTRRRKFITLHKVFLLLTEQELLDFESMKTGAEIRIATSPVIYVTNKDINVTEIPLNVTGNTTSKVKESKVKREREESHAPPISFEFLLGEVLSNCQQEKFSRFIPQELAVKLSHIIKNNGFKKATGKDVVDWTSQIYLLMEKELEFSK